MRPIFKAPRRIFRKYFIAHEDNAHHPHIFRPRAVLAFLACILVLESGLFLYASRWENGGIGRDAQRAAVIANAMVTYTNEARATEQLPPLIRNSVLDLAAQKKAADMIAKGYFAHYSPEGVAPWHWLSEAGYRYDTAGENLAIDFHDSKDVVTAWMNSPGHRKNIMKQKYAEIGMAVAEGQFENRKTIFVVQFFGTPAAMAAAAPVPVTTATATSQVETAPIAAEAPVPKPARAAQTPIAPAVIADSNSAPAASITPPEPSPVIVSAPVAVAIADATMTPPEVAGLSTESASGMFARISNEMFGFTASPRNAIEMVLFILIACVLGATLLYMHGSKNPEVHRMVSVVSVSLVIILTLFIMMNRTYLRMNKDSVGPAAETSLETDAASAAVKLSL